MIRSEDVRFHVPNDIQYDWAGILHTGPPPSGISVQRSAPLGSGTHGTPLQQSAADAQVSPVLRHIPPRP